MDPGQSIAGAWAPDYVIAVKKTTSSKGFGTGNSNVRSRSFLAGDKHFTGWRN